MTAVMGRTDVTADAPLNLRNRDDLRAINSQQIGLGDFPKILGAMGSGTPLFTRQMSNANQQNCGSEKKSTARVKANPPFGPVNSKAPKTLDTLKASA